LWPGSSTPMVPGRAAVFFRWTQKNPSPVQFEPDLPIPCLATPIFFHPVSHHSPLSFFRLLAFSVSFDSVVTPHAAVAPGSPPLFSGMASTVFPGLPLPYFIAVFLVSHGSALFLSCVATSRIAVGGGRTVAGWCFGFRLASPLLACFF